MIGTLKERLSNYQPVLIGQDRPKAGVLVALTDDSDDPHVILTRRSTLLSSHGGEVAFPGGKYDHTDPNLEYTALREAHEEVGLKPEQVEVVGQLGQVISKHRLQVTPFVAVVPEQVELVPNPSELDAIFKVPVSFLLQTDNYKQQLVKAGSMRYHVPAWQFESYTIWGLTAYILAELVNVAFDGRIPMKAREEHFGER